MKKVIVAGGGLAGLSTAALLLQKGYQVTLLEKMGEVGGRGGTLENEGFRMNLGAHAVYGWDKSFMKQVLDRLGIQLSLATPEPYKLRYELENGELTAAPVNLSGIWQTKLLPGTKDKLDFIKAVASILYAPQQVSAGQTLGEWLDKHSWSPAAKKLLSHLAGSNFFTSDPHSLEAERFLAYYKRIFRAKQPVSYIQGGWSAVVRKLEQYLVDNGAVVETKTPLTGLLFSEGKLQGVQAKKKEFEADAVVLCIPPFALKKPLDETPLAPILEPYLEQPTNTVIVYDVALSSRVRSDVSYVSDKNHHIFITDPSLYDPDSVPPGGQLLQAIAYAGPGVAGNPDAVASLTNEVESLYDRHYPGWRDVLVFKRVLEQATVQAVSPASGQRRFPAHFTEVHGVYFAGDWCEGEGSVSDVAFYSAWQAANQLS